ncbi:MAG TPA: serine hydrolase domain-containing protein, partial [Mycobacterium sp.]|nr:serine hydrolase domain-containing protein [Mycobacterium sp.]
MRCVVLPVAMAATLALIACSNRPLSKSVSDNVDRLFAEWNKPDSPGCSLGVSRNGTVVYEHGYGMANLDLGVAITPASVFDAASVAKQFTAMSILLLAQRRQLSLDDGVGKYIPNWGEHGHQITIRHLLTHTSGLRDAFLLQGLAPDTPEDTNQKIVNILVRARGLNFVPGTEFEYNNGAFTLLAGVVERVSGRALPAFAEANIFKPLGMTHTYFHDDATRIVPNRATGYSRAANGFQVAVRTYTDVVVGNAGLFTTVGDLLRWEQNLADVRVGDPALIAEMQKPAIATGWSETSGYGFGIEIARHRGLLTIGHGGGDEGRRAYVVRYPDRGLAIAVLCNLDDIDPAAVSRSIADSFLADVFPESAGLETTGAAATPHPVALSLQELQNKVGLYHNLSEESVGRIFMREGKLMASENASDSGGFELTPIGANRFVIVGTSVVAEFAPPAAGKPQEISVTRAGAKPKVSQLITTPFRPSSAQLRAFEGTYTSEDVHGTYTVVPRDSGLVIQIPTRSEIPLQPLFTDAFGGNILGVVKFSRD